MNIKKAFTLIEVIIVIAILGILAVILVPVMINVVEDANEAVLKANCNGIQSFIAFSSLKFDENHLFENSDDSGSNEPDEQTTLSRYIEAYFEQAGYGKNNFAIQNPYSKKTGILNYSSYNLPSQYRQQALVVSDNSKLKYSNALSKSDGKTYLKGSVIIYMKNGYNQIEIYYIDSNGEKSDTAYVISVA